jgi:thymidylate synthase
MNNIDKQYQALLKDILENGVTKEDRTGTGTISVFGRQIRHKMSEGFPLLTTKKMAWKTMVTELLWFLNGDTNIKYLVDNDCHIWDGDAFKNYIKKVEDIIDGYMCGDIMGMQPHIASMFSDSDKLIPLTKEQFIGKIKTDNEFAKKWGDLGPIYGKQWRNWESVDTRQYWQEDWSSKDTDQIQNLIDELKTNPDSRRLMVSAWNVGELDQVVLPPCHYGFQIYTRKLSHKERFIIHSNNPIALQAALDNKPLTMEETNTPTRAISLMWNQRSVDTFLGLPFNIASYGLLLEILAKIVNMIPDELICNLGDVHLYSNHIDQAKEQIGRKYTHEERTKMLEDAMGSERYVTSLKECVPFGGGMHEYYDAYNIPIHTREPYKLPKLIIPKTDAFWDTFDVTLFGHLDPTDFNIEGYQSHPTIKAPLSN